MSISLVPSARQDALIPGKATASEMPGCTIVVRQGFERSDADDREHSHEPNRMLKNYCGSEEPGTGGSHGMFQPNPQAVQKGCPARPKRVKIQGVPSGAHGATNKEH